MLSKYTQGSQTWSEVTLGPSVKALGLRLAILRAIHYRWSIANDLIIVMNHPTKFGSIVI